LALQFPRSISSKQTHRAWALVASLINTIAPMSESLETVHRQPAVSRCSSSWADPGTMLLPPLLDVYLRRLLATRSHSTAPTLTRFALIRYGNALGELLGAWFQHAHHLGGIIFCGKFGGAGHRFDQTPGSRLRPRVQDAISRSRCADVDRTAPHTSTNTHTQSGLVFFRGSACAGSRKNRIPRE
jgi:hypothetical protein